MKEMSIKNYAIRPSVCDYKFLWGILFIHSEAIPKEITMPFYDCLQVSAVILVLSPSVLGSAQLGSQRTCCGLGCFPRDRNTGCCGERPYHRFEEVCCEDGRVLKRQQGSACCGFSTFDPAWQTCCNAQIVNITGVSCCKGELYSRHSASCCAGVVSEKLSGLISQCCGSEPYNPRYQVCCGGKLWDQQPGLRCCGQALYNITSELCIHHLSKVIKKETPHALLCGDRQYDNETHFCCEDLNVYTRTVRCCGNASTPYRTYNPLNASCCNGVIHEEVPELEGKSCSNLKMCGSNQYNSLSSVCLHGKIVPVAYVEECGGALNKFDSRESLCCGGQLYLKLDDMACCGQAWFNTTQHQCLGELVRKRGSDARLSMCGRNAHFDPISQRCCINSEHKGEPYGPGQTCCNGTVHETTGTALNGGRCCNGKGYNPETDFCCSGQTHELSEWQRLGEGSYLQNDGGLICCNHTLHRVSAGERECQGGIPYNPALETVCAGLVHRTTHEHCCGQHTYRPDTEVCCRGRRQPWPRHHSQAECCGAWAYDPLDPETRCCGDTLHRVPRGAASLRCCGSLLVDTDTHSCCASETQQVSFRRAPGLACCGHTPYNTSRESCCAHRLSRGRQPRGAAPGECVLMQLEDMSQSAVCNATVLVGQVTGMTIRGSRIVYRLTRVIEVLASHSGALQIWEKLAAVQLDHCGCPPLALDRSYAFCLTGQLQEQPALSAGDSVYIAPLLSPSALHSLAQRRARCKP
ncbi:uncharacterized protein [Lepisosteus oculatus]|uniref:uncharacterized protein n=1 Tax=Lepisosteus oculatus TaxID=7918 RepID=UPI0037141122